MILKNELAGFLEKMLVANKTPKFDSVPKDIYFVREKGILFLFNQNLKSVFLKDETVDFNAKIEGDLFVTYALKSLKKNGEVEVSYKSNAVVFNEFSFKTSEFDADIVSNYLSRAADSCPYLTFNAEQWAKLRPAFKYSYCCSFTNPKSTATIGFAFNEGSCFKLLPGIYAYKIEKFDAVLETTAIEQSFGHNTKIYLLPEKVYELAGENSNSYSFRLDDSVVIVTDKLVITYIPEEYGTNWFLKRVKYFGRQPAENAFNFSELKVLIDLLPSEYVFENNEDKLIELSIKNKKASILIDNELSINCDQTIEAPDTLIAWSAQVFYQMLIEATENSKIELNKEIDEFVIKEPNSITYLPHCVNDI